MFVTKIHNNRLGSSYSVSSWEDGVELVKRLASDCRPITAQDIETAENQGEIYDESDPDNIWCVSIGLFEDS